MFPKSLMGRLLLVKLVRKRRAWLCMFIVVYSLLLTISWALLNSVFTWYKSSSSFSLNGWRALYASLALGEVLGFVSMVVALSVALPTMLVTWITILVLLSVSGKSRRVLLEEGIKASGEIARVFGMFLLKEWNVVAAAVAVLGYFALRWSSGSDYLSSSSGFS